MTDRRETHFTQKRLLSRHDSWPSAKKPSGSGKARKGFSQATKTLRPPTVPCRASLWIPGGPVLNTDHLEAEDLAPAVAAHTDGDERRGRDDPPGLAHPQREHSHRVDAVRRAVERPPTEGLAKQGIVVGREHG
jgi:hypothetical protein